ncbi:MAG TPA: HAMP domain-containing sensor histidine kinase [Afifellaceae bacterium]|nr:HAMP domain-containing sensor histidine kinase [Afifellaceae bacterium]
MQPEEVNAKQAAEPDGPDVGELRPARVPAGGRRLGRGLSDRLLILTILFVMLAEVLIYIPSVSNFRNVWLQDRLDSAAVAAIALNIGMPHEISAEAQKKMLAAIGVEAIAMGIEGRRVLIATGTMPESVSMHHDLTELHPLESIWAAFATLFGGGDSKVRVTGRPPAGTDEFEIVLAESGLRNAMLIYSRNILLISLVISMITAALVYAALRAMIVRPIERLSSNMLAFSEDPESEGSVIVPSGRRDEIGIAEEQLAAMQIAMRGTLQQRRHLADLGLAVSKINHDLRNILASAQLFVDRIGDVEDPLVKRFAPKVIGAIDRAIGYTRAVLSYGQATEAPPRRRQLRLARLVDDVADILALPPDTSIQWDNRVPADLEVDADPDQLFRVVLNVCRNAVDALSQGDDPAIVRRLWIEGERRGSVVILDICDNGPGVPERAREALFKPFRGSARPGGTGLGLAIAAELAAAHGGDIALVEKSGCGAVFRIQIPDRPVNLDAARSAAKA